MSLELFPYPLKEGLIDYINSKSEKNQRIIACIGDSLTHGNMGQSWVDYLRKEFPNDVFLMKVLMVIQLGKLFKDLIQYLDVKPDIVILMIGTNDAWAHLNSILVKIQRKIIYLKFLHLRNTKNIK